MQEPQIRGHVILSTLAFLRLHSEAAQRPYEADISLELRQALEGVKAAGWYPRQHHTGLLSALTAGKARDEAAIYAALLECGASLAAPDNQFSRLLMKVMTPELFLKKLPKFWSRDHQHGGQLELEALDEANARGKIRLSGVAGYNHAAIVWLGFVKGVLDELTGGDSAVQQTGWSYTSPGPNDVFYEVHWS